LNACGGSIGIKHIAQRAVGGREGHAQVAAVGIGHGEVCQGGGLAHGRVLGGGGDACQCGGCVVDGGDVDRADACGSEFTTHALAAAVAVAEGPFQVDAGRGRVAAVGVGDVAEHIVDQGLRGCGAAVREFNGQGSGGLGKCGKGQAAALQIAAADGEAGT